MKTEPLPPLPRQKKQDEAEFGVSFRRWWATAGLPSASFELKHTHGEAFCPLSEVSDAQIAHGMMIERGGDLIRVLGGSGEPDYVALKGSPAYIVVRYPSCFVLVRVPAWVAERARGTRSSLTEARAQEIAEVVVNVRGPPRGSKSQRQ